MKFIQIAPYTAAPSPRHDKPMRHANVGKRSTNSSNVLRNSPTKCVRAESMLQPDMLPVAAEACDVRLKGAAGLYD